MLQAMLLFALASFAGMFSNMNAFPVVHEIVLQRTVNTVCDFIHQLPTSLL